MRCKEGFDEKEAQEAGICEDCSRHWCDRHPEHISWLKKQGFARNPALQVAAPKVAAPQSVSEDWVPEQVIRGRQVRSYNRNGLKDLRWDVSKIVSKALKVQAECAEYIVAQEDLKSWKIKTKRGVWATYCRTSALRENFIQFGEGPVVLHYGGVSSDTVKSEMRRFGWRWSTEEGWLMTVIHEVAHALHKKRKTGGSSHGYQFHACLKDLREKYFKKLLPKFQGIIPEKKKIAANSTE